MKDEGKEKWVPVVRYEGIYEISDFGNAKRAMGGKGTFVGRVLKQASNVGGYKTVRLYNNEGGHTHSVHVLVMRAFVGPRSDGNQTNHIDGDKKNNCLGNLEYATPAENTLHSFRTGLASNKGEMNPRSKLTEKDVLEIRKRLSKETQAAIAVRFNVHPSTISLIALGKSWAYLKEEDDDERT